MGTARTRERIVGGAARVFAVRGIGDATVQQVLDSAGVSRRTFYQYFTGKEDVLAAVYHEYMDALLMELAGGLQGTDDPVQKVIQAMDKWLDFQLTGGVLLASLQAEAARPESQLHARREQTLDAIASTIGAAVQETLQVEVDPLVFRALALGVEGAILHLVESDRLETDRGRIRRVVAAMFLNVLAGAENLPGPPALAEVDTA